MNSSACFCVKPSKSTTIESPAVFGFFIAFSIPWIIPSVMGIFLPAGERSGPFSETFFQGKRTGGRERGQVQFIRAMLPVTRSKKPGSRYGDTANLLPRRMAAVNQPESLRGWSARLHEAAG